MARPTNDSVFAEAAQEMFPAMVRYARAVIGPEHAEDAAQEALVRAWRYLGSFDGRGSFEGWLFRICRRCAYDVARREANRSRPGPGLAAYNVGHADAVHLELLIQSLPGSERDAFACTQLAGLSYAETAEALEVPIGTVRSRVARARRLLAEAMLEAEAS